MLFHQPTAALLFFIVHFCHCSYKTCYTPNGTVADQDLPCHNDTVHSACCTNGYGCANNNICVNLLNLQETAYTRGSCTDQNWDDPACPQFCKADTVGGDNIMSSCGSDTRYCCWPYGYVDGTCDCNNASGIVTLDPLLPITALVTDGSVIIATTGIEQTVRTVQTCPTTTKTIMATATSGAVTSHASLSIGAKAGISVGAVIAAAAIVALTGLLLHTQRKLKQYQETERAVASSSDRKAQEMPSSGHEVLEIGEGRDVSTQRSGLKPTSAVEMVP